MKKRECIHCGDTRESQFYRNSKSICKKCHSIHYYQKNKEEAIRYQNKWNKDNLLRVRWVAAKSRAEKRGYKFTITYEYLQELRKKQNNKCVYSGIEMTDEFDYCYSVSLDRVDSNKGYTEENTQLVCSAVNRAKGALSEKTFLELIEKISIYRN